MSIVKLAPASRCEADAARDLSMLAEGKSFVDEGSEYLFSDLKGKESEVISGEYAGKKLGEYISLMGWDCLGSDAKGYTKLPISIKAARSDGNRIFYSPDKKRESFWYVAEAQDNANIYFGVKEEISKELLEAALKNGTWKSLLQPVPAKQGDIFQVDAGTVYAFDQGVTLLEISKEDGEADQPVLEDVMSSLNLKPISHDYHEADWLAEGQGERAAAGRNDVFEFDLYQLNGRVDMKADDRSFKVIVVLDGTAVIEKDDMILHAAPWNTFLAASPTDTFHITGNCKFALVHLVK